jgi:hypothetical protein
MTERPSTPHLSLVKSGMAPSRRQGKMTAVARLAQRSLRFSGAACQSGVLRKTAPPLPGPGPIPPGGISPHSCRAGRCKCPRLTAVSANSGVSLLGPDTYKLSVGKAPIAGTPIEARRLASARDEGAKYWSSEPALGGNRGGLDVRLPRFARGR